MRKLLVLLTLLALTTAANARDGQASFSPVANATSYTIYMVADDGTTTQIATGTESPIAITIDDELTRAAFVITSSNEKYEGPYSDPAYWILRTNVILNYPESPSTLTINFK